MGNPALLARDEFGRPFDLTNELPLRATLPLRFRRLRLPLKVGSEPLFNFGGPPAMAGLAQDPA